MSFLKRFLQSFMSVFGLKITKISTGVSTNRQHLTHFSHNGTDREWQQIAMYCSVMNQVANVPGDFAEFGVAGGTSLSAFARLINVFDPYKTNKIAKRKLYGFDTFEGLPFFDAEKDSGVSVPNDMKKGGFNSSLEYNSLLDWTKKYDFIKLYKGTFDKTLDKFFEENKHASFALIHIDCDLHQSTIDALKPTIERLNVGGIILFDEIFHMQYPGETSGFFEVYNGLPKNFTLEFVRLESMPWKWYAVRKS